MTDAAKIPVSVLTGFLGSGKTTLLNHLVTQPALCNTLVLINEFGQIGLDHRLVATSEDQVVVEMSSGCLCCTFRADLVSTLRNAPSRFSRGGTLWFDRVVIETTGLADPAPILHTLMNDSGIKQRYFVDHVITTIDAVNGQRTLDRHIESVKQAAVADRLIITKCDSAGRDELTSLQQRLQQLNPTVSPLVVTQGVIDPGVVLRPGRFSLEDKPALTQQWLQDEVELDALTGAGDAKPVSRHDARVNTVSIELRHAVTRDSVDRWLASLQQFAGEKLLRIKAIFNVQGNEHPLVIHGVQHVFHEPGQLHAWSDETRCSQIVLITCDIEEAMVRQTFTIFEASKTAA